MKPIKLEFQGINSFSEHTIIDFDALTKGGIFGIFGDTGSGKSTILDAINFALYGDVERSKEKTDIINYNSDRADVKFVFNIINEGRRKTYTVERVLKKDKSGTHRAMLYENDGEREVCIADKATQVEKKIIEILGVEAEDFRKCIALPQGEFSQFVKSTPSVRLALIERLFNLSRYGDRLKEKIAIRQSETELRFQNLSGRLQFFEDVTAERLAQTNKKLKQAVSELKKLKKEEESVLKKYEQLKEVVSFAHLLEKKTAEIEGFNEDIKRLQNELGAHISSVYGIQKQIDEGRHDEKIAACVELAARYSSCDGKAEKLKSISAELGTKRDEYKKAEEERQILLIKQQEILQEIESCKSEIESRSFKDICGLINVEFKGAVLKEEYISSLDYFANFNSNVKIFKEDTPLYNYVSGELKQKIKEYTARIEDMRSFKTEYIGEQLENLSKKEKEREEFTQKLTHLNEKLQALTAQLTAKQSELDAISKSGKDLRERADELKDELCRAFGKDCTDYPLAIRQNAQNLAALRAEKQELTDKLNRAKDKESSLNLSVEGLKSLILAATKEKESAEEKLDILLKERALADVERQKILAATDCALKEAECEKSSIYGGVTKITGEIAVLESDLKSLETRLEEKGNILKDFEAVQSERNLISRLKEATKGNRFLEYIANEYLGDISRLASSTLLKLTGGRYFLAFKDNNFSVGDNFNCGNLRGVNTLSGGETFLVSLSLALALSQTICAKSLKSIEFFFLDEGFGTLDGVLLDTVINALEKLKSSSFTIGIISHVEELKNRIPIKITVNKATESHGSTVTLSC